MIDSFLNPGVAAIWRKNFDALPVETRNFLNRASDMLVAECAAQDPSMKRHLIRLWLNEVAYGSESRVQRRYVSGCALGLLTTTHCTCKDGFGHKWPAVRWHESAPSEVFDVVYMKSPKSGTPEKLDAIVALYRHDAERDFDYHATGHIG
jgi:hypothetical protein